MLHFDALHYQLRGQQLLHIPEAHTFQPGRFYGLLGANGSGKSTLLKALSGDLPHTYPISFHGTFMHTWRHTDRARHLGVLPQHHHLPFAFKAIDVVELGLTPLSLGQAAAQQATRRSMTLCQCTQLGNRNYLTLSGGEKQRVQLARVLLQLSQAQQAPLLLLDEPTSAQDLGQQHSILSLAKQLAHEHGYLVIAALHDLNQVLRYCDEVMLMAHGQVQARGCPKSLLTAETIEAYWRYRPTMMSIQEGASRQVVAI